MKLNIGQKKRLFLVMAIPLMVTGAWLAEGGYKHFIAANLETYCSQVGECSGTYTKEIDRWPTKGLHLDHAFSRSRLSGSLFEEVVEAESGLHQRVFVPPTVDAGFGGCALQFHDNYPLARSNNTAATLTDVFLLDCGIYSVKPFRFQNQAVQEKLKLAFRNNAEIVHRFNQLQTVLTVFSFFAPSILFLVLLGLLALANRIFRWIKLGSQIRTG